MTTTQQEDYIERRADVRLAGGGNVEVVLIDDAQRPVEVLRDTQVLNISAGGMALVSRTSVTDGSRLRIRSNKQVVGRPSNTPVQLECLDCTEFGGSMHKIRCKLTEGHMPAELIYSW